MKGLWIWPSEPSDQDKTLRKIMQEDELVTILLTLTKSPEGLSNAQLDRLLTNNSQWHTLSHIKELMSLGLIRYRVQFFGEAGRYELTDLGNTAVSRIQASS